MTTRVLQVLGRSAGGIARHVAAVTAALDGDAMVVDVAGPADLVVAMPKEVVALDIPEGAVGHRLAISRLRDIVSGGGYDAVHAHGLRAGIDAALATRALDVDVLLTVHNLVRPDVSGRVRAAVYRWAEPAAVRLCDRTFAVSEDIARHLRARSSGAASKVEVLYLGAGQPPDIERRRDVLRKELELEEHDKLVVTASRLSAQKALDVMLDAMAGLDEGVVLAVLGEGPDARRLMTRSIALGLSRRVKWLGFRSDIADWLAAADAFCLSSNWEGVPLAAQEAILVHTPVVATDVGGMSELITDRVSGRLVGKGDAPALAAALNDVLTDEVAAMAYAEKAISDLQRRFSTPRMLARLREAYEWHAR